MQVINELIQGTFKIMEAPLDICGYTVSFWSVIVWSVIGTVLITIIKILFDLW